MYLRGSNSYSSRGNCISLDSVGLENRLWPLRYTESSQKAGTASLPCSVTSPLEVGECQGWLRKAFPGLRLGLHKVMNGPVMKMLALKEECACFLALVTKGNQRRKLSPLFSTQGFPSASSSQDINATFEHHKVTIY